MSAEQEEKQKIIQEWIEKSKSDLDSAQVIFKQTDHYEIAVYHAHQAIEKILKAELLGKNIIFKFSHDINLLLEQVMGKDSDLFEGVSFVNSLYPRLRYPTGDTITQAQAQKSIEIASLIFAKLKR